MLDNVIIIPYRARERQLKYYIDNSVRLLQKYLPNSKVVIVEQDWNNKLFNRGCLLNIGAKEYENKTNHIITQDVDINPLEKSIKELYLPNVEDNNIKGLYNFSDSCDTLGGIIKMKNSTFFKINGFPNDIWGWGAEDIALLHRAKYFNIKIYKTVKAHDLGHTNRSTGIYENENYIVFNNINDRVMYNNSKNIQKYNLNNYNDKIVNIKNSGLNNINYEIINKQIINDYTEKILVKI
jgi:hypothetical protein